MDTTTLTSSSPQSPNPPVHVWTDAPDAVARIEQLLASGQINESEARQLMQFREEGYFILPAAIDARLIDSLRIDLLLLPADKEKYLVRVPRPSRKQIITVHPNTSVLPPYSRLLDIYVNNQAARDMILSSPLTRMLSLIYGEAPLVFQSLLFTWGTQHELHTDNGFIVADPPCAIVASWIALEDVVEGAGELAFYPGTHKDPLFLFDKDKIAWQKERDGVDIKREYVRHLEAQAARHEANKQTFLGKKGDVIIWHANLLHYGTTRIKQEHTRYSLLTHYCPASGTPNYFNFFQDSYRKPWKEGFYSSRRYNLRPGMENPYPVFKG